MSEPKIDWDIPLQGIVYEVMSAMSSLNMEPSPLVPPKGTYLSETDEWVEHAMSHLTAACQLAAKAARRQSQLLSNLEYVLDVCHHMEAPIGEEDFEQWAIDALKSVIKQARARRGKPTAEEIVRELAAISAGEVSWAVEVEDVHDKALEFVSQGTERND